MATRTTTFATNDILAADDLNSLAGAWNSYTPTLSQGASADISKTVAYAKYLQFGKLVICDVRLNITAGGTAGSPIYVTLPVTAATSGLVVGTFSYYDDGTYYAGAVLTATNTTAWFLTNAATADFGVNPAVTVASSDIVRFSIMYEAA